MSIQMTKRGWIIVGTIAAVGIAVLTYAGLNGKLPGQQETADQDRQLQGQSGSLGH